MSERQSAHEDLSRPDDARMGSEREFGLVIGGFLAIVAAYLAWRGNTGFWGWLAAAAVFAACALLLPAALRPLNRIWYRFGLLLHRIVSPVILGLMFFAVFVPLGFVMRIAGKRPLGLSFDRSAKSYWIKRQAGGLDRDSFRNQF
jgi:hypothetical protein